MPTTVRPTSRKHSNGLTPKARRVAKVDRLSAPSCFTEPLAKTADSKGRVLLGGKFANRAVLIEELSETEVLVKMARVIPERESWLYENSPALAAVHEGLAQARAGKVNRGPNLRSDEALISQLED